MVSPFPALLLTDDYRSHTSCVTEVERYEKRAPKKNGKVPPQQLWMSLIADSVHQAPRQLKHYLLTMATLDNVPRKEKPFRNFTANSLNLRGKSGETTVSEIWNYLKDLREKQQQNTQQSASLARPKMTSSRQSALPPKEIPANAEDSSSVEKNDQALEENMTTKKQAHEKSKSKRNKKAVKKAMKNVLKNATDQTLTLKLLRKEVRKILDGIAKGQVKELVQQNLNHFVVDGKMVTLKKD